MKYQNKFEETLAAKVSADHIKTLDAYCRRNDCNRSQAIRKMIEEIESKIHFDIHDPHQIATLAEAVAKYQAKN